MTDMNLNDSGMLLLNDFGKVRVLPNSLLLLIEDMHLSSHPCSCTIMDRLCEKRHHRCPKASTRDQESDPDEICTAMSLPFLFLQARMALLSCNAVFDTVNSASTDRYK